MEMEGRERVGYFSCSVREEGFKKGTSTLFIP